MKELLLNYLPEILTGVIFLLTSVFGFKLNKLTKIKNLAVLFVEMIEDGKITDDELKKFVAAYRVAFPKKVIKEQEIK